MGNHNKTLGLRAAKPKIPVTFTYAVCTFSLTNDAEIRLKIGGNDPKVFDTAQDAVSYCTQQNAGGGIIKGISFVPVTAEITEYGTIFSFCLTGVAFALKPRGQ